MIVCSCRPNCYNVTFVVIRRFTLCFTLLFMDHDDVLIVSVLVMRATSRSSRVTCLVSFVVQEDCIVELDHRYKYNNIVEIIILRYVLHLYLRIMYDKERYYIRGEIFSRTVCTLRRYYTPYNSYNELKFTIKS